MEEAKGQSILDKMLTTFINTLVKVADEKVQAHFGKNLEELLTHFMAKVNSEFERQCLLWYFLGKGKPMEVSSEVFQRIAEAAVQNFLPFDFFPCDRCSGLFYFLFRFCSR